MLKRMQVRSAQEETDMGIVKLAAALVALSMLAGCNSTSTRNSWQSRVEDYFMNPARSCASGYYDCTLRSSNRARDQSHNIRH
jgi:hypothetical protein